MIVITSPTSVINEISIIHSLFESGLTLLHVRKPAFSEIEMVSFLTSIGSDFRNQLVVHSHFHLADSFGINRLHNPKEIKEIVNPIFSTSTHSIVEFNGLENNYSYAFLSPIYPSISKLGYIPIENHLETIKKRSNFNSKLVALGGISAENISEIFKKGFDEVALLGTIWNNSNPVENFKRCHQIALSF